MGSGSRSSEQTSEPLARSPSSSDLSVAARGGQVAAESGQFLGDFEGSLGFLRNRDPPPSHRLANRLVPVRLGPSACAEPLADAQDPHPWHSSYSASATACRTEWGCRYAHPVHCRNRTRHRSGTTACLSACLCEGHAAIDDPLSDTRVASIALIVMNFANLLSRRQWVLSVLALLCVLLWLLTATTGVRDVHLWAEPPPIPSPLPPGTIVDHFGPTECSSATLKYSSKAIAVAPLVLLWRHATTGHPEKCLEHGYAVLLWLPTMGRFPIVIPLILEYSGSSM